MAVLWGAQKEKEKSEKYFCCMFTLTEHPRETYRWKYLTLAVLLLDL